MVKANVDRMLELLEEKKPVSLGELSRKLGVSKEDLQKTAEYLEEDGVIKIENKFPNVFITLLKDPGMASYSDTGMPPPPSSQVERQPRLQVKEPLKESINPYAAPQQQQPLPQPAPMYDEQQMQSPVINVTVQGMPQYSGQQAPGMPQAPMQQMQSPPAYAQQSSGFQPQQGPPQMQPATAYSSQPAQTIIMQQQMQPSAYSNPSAMPVAPQPAQAMPGIPLPPQAQQPQFQSMQLVPPPKPKMQEQDFNMPLPPPKRDSVLGQAPLQGTLGLKEPEEYQRLSDPQNPYEMKKPYFEMPVPTPEGKKGMFFQQAQMQTAVADLPEDTAFPSSLHTGIEKIEFLIEEGHKKITNHDYKELNVLYRQVYNMFREADDLSPNERYLIGERIDDLFKRIKGIYLVEGVTA